MYGQALLGLLATLYQMLPSDNASDKAFYCKSQNIALKNANGQFYALPRNRRLFGSL